MVISVDHGNKQIKTVHHTFTSGLVENNTPPALGGRAIQFGGRFYSLSEQRIPYMRDKTADDRFFILTLFAVFKELESVQGFLRPREDVSLLIGLPPSHFGAQQERFCKYFLDRGEISCEYDGKPHTISFSSVKCYPQAYAAAMLRYNELVACPRCRIIDIGGFTVDYLQTMQGRPDMGVCGSLENGIITFYNRAIQEINSSFDILLEEPDIDAILKGSKDYSAALRKYVLTAAQEFVDDLGYRFRELGVDLRLGKVIFVGGGAISLKPFITQSKMFGEVTFVGDVNANARGYVLMNRAARRAA